MIEFIKYIAKCFYYILYFGNGGISTTEVDKFYGKHLSVGGMLYLIPLLVYFFIKRYRARYFYDEDIYSDRKNVIIAFIISLAVLFLYLVIAYIFWYPKTN